MSRRAAAGVRATGQTTPAGRRWRPSRAASATALTPQVRHARATRLTLLLARRRELHEALLALTETVDLLGQAPLDEVQHEHVRTLRRSEQIVVAAIRDIVDLSMIECGGLVVDAERLEVLDEPDPAQAAMAFLDGLPASPSRPSVLAGCSVLLVARDACDLHLLDFQLTQFGMTCAAVSNAANAIALAASGLAYDVAVLESDLPRVSGVALGAALAQLPGPSAGAPLILLTSAGRRADALEGSFAATLTKPVTGMALRQTLTSVLGRGGVSHEPAVDRTG